MSIVPSMFTQSINDLVCVCAFLPGTSFGRGTHGWFRCSPRMILNADLGLLFSCVLIALVFKCLNLQSNPRELGS